jgi:hypothetical protein
MASHLFLQNIKHNEKPKNTHISAAKPIPAPNASFYRLTASKNWLVFNSDPIVMVIIPMA